MLWSLEQPQHTESEKLKIKLKWNAEKKKSNNPKEGKKGEKKQQKQ